MERVSPWEVLKYILIGLGAVAAITLVACIIIF